jgi:hypothetical protein
MRQHWGCCGRDALITPCSAGSFMPLISKSPWNLRGQGVGIPGLQIRHWLLNTCTWCMPSTILHEPSIIILLRAGRQGTRCRNDSRVCRTRHQLLLSCSRCSHLWVAPPSTGLLKSALRCQQQWLYINTAQLHDSAPHALLYGVLNADQEEEAGCSRGGASGGPGLRAALLEQGGARDHHTGHSGSSAVLKSSEAQVRDHASIGNGKIWLGFGTNLSHAVV